MRYKGQIGEFKVKGFMIGFLCCLVFALAIYSRFIFVTEPNKDDIKASIDAAMDGSRQLESKVNGLSSQVSDLQRRLSEAETKIKCKK